VKGKRIVVTGFMATCPIAGVVWQHLHYLLGLKQLGCEPIYIEDTARHPYDPASFEIGESVVPRIPRWMVPLAKRFGFRWAYRARFTNPMRTFGDFTDCQIADCFAGADVILNLCGAQELHEDVLKSRCLVYVESDPGAEQVKLDQKNSDTLRYLNQHHAHFTFGENIGQPDCPLPTGGISWKPTRQPVIIDIWKQKSPLMAHGSRLVFTTVANWETKGKDFIWKDQEYYWSKTFEFLKFSDLPQRLDASRFRCEIATDMRRDPASKQLFEQQGWRLTSPHAISRGYDGYVNYIRQSDAEWTVAKDQYVRLKTGWFSDRSACYLAAGRPVITQDTLFGKFIPTSEGLFSFRDMEDIVKAAEAIAGDYRRHSRKAEEIAREYFSAAKVVKSMLQQL